MYYDLNLLLDQTISAPFTVVIEYNTDKVYVQYANSAVSLEQFLRLLPFKWVLRYKNSYIYASEDKYKLVNSLTGEMITDSLEFLVNLMVKED